MRFKTLVLCGCILTLALSGYAARDAVSEDDGDEFTFRSGMNNEGFTEGGEEDFVYFRYDNEITITEYKGEIEHLKIPAAFGWPVRTIGKEAFRGCESLRFLIIPDSVTEIKAWAFTGCESLESVTLSDSLTEIGEVAFSGCKSLESVTIPDSVTKIGAAAFRRCESLESVIFMGDAPKHFGEKVFENTHEDFKIYYYEDASGFSSPKWKGYPTEEKER